MRQAFLALVVTVAALTAHAADPSGPPSKEELAATIKTLKAKPELKKYFSSSFGFAVFPRVGRGAFAVGGAFGEGGLFKAGKETGKTTLAQVTIGLGAGGEQYTEILFLKDKGAYDLFVQGNVQMDAHATAVAATTGVGGAAGYNNGVAIFTFTKGGLMADASVGGQKFTFEKL